MSSESLPPPLPVPEGSNLARLCSGPLVGSVPGAGCFRRACVIAVASAASAAKRRLAAARVTGGEGASHRAAASLIRRLRSAAAAKAPVALGGTVATSSSEADEDATARRRRGCRRAWPGADSLEGPTTEAAAEAPAPGDKAAAAVGGATSPQRCNLRRRGAGSPSGQATAEAMAMSPRVAPTTPPAAPD